MQCSTDTLYRQIILSWLRASTWFIDIQWSQWQGLCLLLYQSRGLVHGKGRYEHAANRHKPLSPNSNTETLKSSKRWDFPGIHDGLPYMPSLKDSASARWVSCAGYREPFCNKRHTCCSCCHTQAPGKKHDMTQFKCARLAFGKNAMKQRKAPVIYRGKSKHKNTAPYCCFTFWFKHWLWFMDGLLMLVP